MEPDSVAASIYHVCRLQALHIVFAGHLGELIDDYVGIHTFSPLGGTSPYHGRSFIRLLRSPSVHCSIQMNTSVHTVCGQA